MCELSSDEDAVSSEMSLSDSDESEQISYSLSDIDSEDPFQSTSIQGASGSGVPLYPDSCITEDGFNTVFLSLVQRHNLTYASQSDVLKLFSILLPSPSKVPSSHVLISKFVNFEEDTIVQHFCGSCAQLLSLAPHVTSSTVFELNCHMLCLFVFLYTCN